VLAPPAEALREAQGLRNTLVEILRHLNRDEMQQPDVPGLEEDELQEILERSFPLITKPDLHRAIQVLVGNGLARELTDPRYAWTRARMVRNRFTITTPGKAFLLQSVQRVGRV
jgi:hypothetical protein